MPPQRHNSLRGCFLSFQADGGSQNLQSVVIIRFAVSVKVRQVLPFQRLKADGVPQDHQRILVIDVSASIHVTYQTGGLLLTAAAAALPLPIVTQGGNLLLFLHHQTAVGADLSGGQTGAVDGVTEAGQMAAWLQRKGLEKGRIIRETQSLSTTANAVNSYKLLTKAYPQVNSIALVTSDYHIAQSCAMFAMVSNYQSGYKGGKSLELVGNAVCDTGLTEDSLLTQAWGMSLIAGIPFDEKAKAPKLYPVDIPVEVYAEPTGTEAVQPEETQAEKSAEKPDPEPEIPESKWVILERWILLEAGVVAVLIFWIIMPKKPKKRNRREKPKMNWDV